MGVGFDKLIWDKTQAGVKIGASFVTCLPVDFSACAKLHFSHYACKVTSIYMQNGPISSAFAGENRVEIDTCLFGVG